MYSMVAQTTSQLRLILSNGANPLHYTECASRLAQDLNAKQVPCPGRKYWTGQELLIRALAPTQ